MINTDGGRYAFSTWTAKLHGTYQAPYSIMITPILRYQAGQPYGRTFVTRTGDFNYGTVRVLAEPITTRRQDNIAIFDIRAEKVFKLPATLKISGIFDLFNAFTSNAEQNLSWSSGSSFLRPLNIIPPRIVRIGARITF